MGVDCFSYLILYPESFLITPVVLDKNVSFLRVGVLSLLKKKNSDQDIAEILLRLELNPNQSIDQCIFITVSHNKR
jgi:hypothetical protein